MKKVVDIWTVINGQLREIKIDDDQVYTIHKKRLEEPKPTVTKKEIEVAIDKAKKPKKELERHLKTARTKRQLKEMGVHFLGTYQNQRIIKEAVEELQDAKTTNQFKQVLKKYYPEVRDISIKRYISTYKSFMEKKARKELPGLDKGEALGRVHHTKVYKNIYDDIKKKMEEKNWSNDELYDIIGKYYPSYIYQSRKTTSIIYKGLVTGTYELKKKVRGYTYKVKKRTRKPPSPNHVAYSKKYKTWVKVNEVREVRRCIGMTKYGYRPTNVAIAGEADLPIYRVRAVLDCLVTQGDVWRKKKGKVSTYHFVNKD